MLFVVLFALVVGCVSSRRVTQADNHSSVRPNTSAELPGPTHLTTNQVLAIAYSCASAHRVDTNRFTCRSIRFHGEDPKQRLAGKWVLHFGSDPMSLHEDFFVDVDDLSGKAALIRH
jgi:hypothetical protein